MMKAMMEASVVAVLIIGILSFAGAQSNPSDAYVLSTLYVSLNYPPQLTNWKSIGGDPCLEYWKGVTCSGSRVTEINISGLGLTGSMGFQLDKLTALTTFDTSNNNIINQIPYQLPPNVQILNLAANGFNSELPYSISLMTSLKYLNVSHNQIPGQVNIQFNSLTFLSTLDFSYNAMTGNLPQSFQSLTNIHDLYLQNNQFTGTIDVLASLPLQNLNVDNNQFTGWIPEQLKGINLHTNGNSFNYGPAPPTPPGTTNGSPRSGDTGRKKAGLGAGGITGIVITFLVLGAVAAFLLVKWQSRMAASNIMKHIKLPFVQLAVPGVEEKRRGQESPASSRNAHESPVVINLRPPVYSSTSFDEDDPYPMPHVPPRKVKAASINARSFSVADLQIATNSFSVDYLIHEGSTGSVYRAKLDDGKIVAVKKINSPTLDNSEDFLEIVSKISRLNHPNISKLVGYCSEHGQSLLVYDFQQNGSLYECLHFLDEFKKPLTWSDRVKVALGTGRALEYLHEVCTPSVVHKNIKSANILLDMEFNPYLSDCGLASLGREPDQASSCNAPEVSMSGQFTIKSDIYSFGIVMLELLTGRKPFDSSRPRSEQSLVRWAMLQLHDIDALSKMADTAMEGLYPAKSLSRFADVIALCLQPEPEFRPPMSEVVEALIQLVQRGNMSKRTFGNGGREC